MIGLTQIYGRRYQFKALSSMRLRQSSFSKITELGAERAFFRDNFSKLRPKFFELCSAATSHVDDILYKGHYELQLRFHTFEDRKGLDIQEHLHCFDQRAEK